MSLTSAQLDAFSEVVKASSFSKAASNLAITQSALSQRVKNLEEELGTSLLIREPSGIRLTPAGEELLQYCKTRIEMENECLSRIRDSRSQSLTGIVRIGGYSTVVRSVVLPSLKAFLLKNPGVRIEMLTKEMRELPRLLRTGEVDYIFLDYALEKEGVDSLLMGHEENVLIESKSGKFLEDVYLDHDLDDDTTFQFFGIQSKKPKKIHRSFFDEIYGIIDGVALGLGRAVVPRHIAREDSRIRIVTGFKSLEVPVYLNYYKQPFYARFQKGVMEQLIREVKTRLQGHH